MCVLLIMIYLKTLCLPFFVLSFLSAEGPREGFDLQSVLNGRFYFPLRYLDFFFWFQNLSSYLYLIPGVPTCCLLLLPPTTEGIRTGVDALCGRTNQDIKCHIDIPAAPNLCFLHRYYTQASDPYIQLLTG